MKRLLLTSALGLVLCSGSAWAQQSYDLTTTIAQAQGSGQYVVYFGLDQSSLSAEARATIAEAARAYQSGATPRISVRAHTDTSGSSDYNQRLSERREQAVANELMAQGVPQSAITGEALGESDPAVATGDGVVEASNRRVDIQVEQPPAPVAEAAPAPEPMPEPTPPPEPRAAPKSYRIFNVGAFYGYNLEDQVGDESQLGGINLGADFPVTPWLSVGLEQAGFYHFDTPNDGAGGRTVASLDLTMGDDDFKPYVGGNVGYLYGSGFDDDFVGGPEIGLAAGPLLFKVAYDIPFNRDLDEGIINTTIGFRF